MAKERNEKEMVSCPVGRFFLDLEKACGKRSNFFEHITQSRMEFLKAVRALLDEKLEDLEKKSSGKATKRMTRVKVE